MPHATVTNLRLLAIAGCWTGSFLLVLLGELQGNMYLALWGLWLGMPAAVLTAWALLVVERIRALLFTDVLIDRMVDKGVVTRLH